MGFKHKSKQINGSMTKGTTLGVGICVVLWFVTSAALASLVVNEHISEETLKWIVPCMQGVVSFIGSVIAGRIVVENKGLASVICTAVYFLVMMCVTMLFFDGRFSSIIWAIIAVAAGGALSILLNLKQKSHLVRWKRVKLSR